MARRTEGLRVLYCLSVVLLLACGGQPTDDQTREGTSEGTSEGTRSAQSNVPGSGPDLEASLTAVLGVDRPSVDELLLLAANEVAASRAVLEAEVRAYDRTVTSVPAFFAALDQQPYASDVEVKAAAEAVLAAAKNFTPAYIDAPASVQDINISYYPPNSTDVGGYYKPPSNTMAISANPTYAPKPYQIASLIAHESTPGHALQFRFSNEPWRQTMNGPIAFVEGWAMYAQQLPRNPGGFYDQLSSIGERKMQLESAVMMLADLKIATGQLTLDQALQFMMDNAYMADANYAAGFVWALQTMPIYLSAYTYGKIKIDAIRSKVVSIIGKNKFTQAHEKAFNTQMLALLTPANTFTSIESTLTAWAQQQ